MQTESLQAACTSTSIQTAVTDGTTQLNKTLWDGEFNNVYDCIDDQVSIGGDTMTGALKMNDNKLYLDSGTDTYLQHAVTNQIDFATNNTARMSVSDSGVYFEGSDVKVAAQKKLYLDGGTDTYIYQYSNDSIDINTGGSTRMSVSNNGVYFEGSDAKIAATKKLYLDGGTHTYLSETTGDDMSVYVGGNQILRMVGNGEVYLPQGLSQDPGGGYPVMIYNNRFYQDSSSIRYKRNVRDLSTVVSSEGVYNLRPVVYQSQNTDFGDNEYVGFIAEEVDKIFPQVVVKNSSGQADAIKYDRLVVFLVQEMKKMNDRIIELEGKLK